jgi:hypothetical protein
LLPRQGSNQACTYFGPGVKQKYVSFCRVWFFEQTLRAEKTYRQMQGLQGLWNLFSSEKENANILLEKEWM